jgi:hypothetical protein
MKKHLLVVCLAFVIIACSKDKFETKPQLTLKSISEIVPVSGTMSAVLEYTDKEGDVQDTFFYQKQRINKRGPISSTWIKLPMPTMPNTSKGEINFSLEYTNLANFTAINVPGGGNQKEPDSLVFKIYLKDRAQNASDTLITPFVSIVR